MSVCRDFFPLDNTAIEEMLKKQFKGGPEKLAGPLIDHVRTLVNRHIEACNRNEVDPEIDRTLIEAVEDYHLKQKTGISVLDKAPEEAELPVQRLLQYVSPRRSEL
jgi:hypothetical protein